jgi:hypothetical protein
MIVTAPPPLADASALAKALALLGHTVPATAEGTAEQLHLARALVAAAEQQAIAAEASLAAEHGGVLPAEHATTDHQGEIDLAASGSALMLLALAYWRSERLSAATQALADAFTCADTANPESGDVDPDDNPVNLTWELAVSAAAATSGLLRFLAGITTDDGAASVQALDAATGLLVLTGRRADRLRRCIGYADAPAWNTSPTCSALIWGWILGDQVCAGEVIRSVLVRVGWPGGRFVAWRPTTWPAPGRRSGAGSAVAR